MVTMRPDMFKKGTLVIMKVVHSDVTDIDYLSGEGILINGLSSTRII